MSQSFQHNAQMPAPRRKESRQRSRAQSTQGAGYFGFRPEHPRSGEDERRNEEDGVSPLASPIRPSTALGKIASYIGFARPDHDVEAGIDARRPSRSRSRSSRESVSENISRSPTSSADSWGCGDEDDGYSEHDREEGYSSSLADNTSLPPQSRPQSPHLPLIPNPSDGIFGEPASRGFDQAELKDFDSLAVPSRQTVVLPDEDLSIRFIGYRSDPFRNALWWAGCILTFGALGLFGRWVPSVWVRFCGQETTFEDERDGAWIVVEVSTPCQRVHSANGLI